MTPDGMGQKIWLCRMASGSCFSLRTVPSCNPAEHLWEFVDEPLVNTYFETIEDLEKVVSDRCVALTGQREMIRASTLFHWWPKPCKGN